jgi:hypothetical protein
VAGPAVLVGTSPFPFGESGGVGGAFLRSVPGKTGTVTLTARHRTLGAAAVAVRVAPVRSGNFLLDHAGTRYEAESPAIARLVLPSTPTARSPATVTRCIVRGRSA